MTPLWPPTRFWQIWALAGRVILTAAFWWGVEGSALHASGRAVSQIADGLLRFSLLVLTPALAVGWLAAAWLRRRVGDKGYWQLLGLLAIIWTVGVLIARLVMA